MTKIISIQRLENSYKTFMNDLDGKEKEVKILFIVFYQEKTDKISSIVISEKMLCSEGVYSNPIQMYKIAAWRERDVLVRSDNTGLIKREWIEWLKETVIEGVPIKGLSYVDACKVVNDRRADENTPPYMPNLVADKFPKKSFI